MDIFTKDKTYLTDKFYFFKEVFMAGKYTKRGNKYRLQYMKDGQRYSTTVDAKTDKEAKTKLAEFVTEVEKGLFYNTNYTFFEFAQIWIDEVQKPNSSPVTVNKYKSYLNNRIIPYLGNYKLNKINASILNSYFNEVKTWKTMYKPPRQNVPISKSTVEKIYEIVTAILQKAFEWDLILSNPCKKVKIKFDNMESEIQKTKEKGEKKEVINSYTKEEYKSVLELLKKEEPGKRILIETALKSGLSKEELFGLRWSDFDVENSTLSVKVVRLYTKETGIIEKQPKAHSRIRTISIPNSLCEALKSFKTKFDKNEDYIFKDININSIGSWFTDFQKRNNIRKIRFHDLRHTHATLLLYKGVDIKTISKRLGHSKIGITMDTYTDVLKELDLSASQKMDEI